MFGPLGFYEILFILGIAFLLLGPRQMSVLSGNLGRTLRDFYKATADVRRQINAERAALEEEVRREQKPLKEALDEMKQLDRSIRQETGGDWSRRSVLGQQGESPKVKPQALPADRSGSSADGTVEDSDGASHDGPTGPVVRTPEGLTARGSLDPDPIEPDPSNVAQDGSDAAPQSEDGEPEDRSP